MTTNDEFAHITNEEILKDIADTEAEIVTLTKESQAYSMLEDRMSQFRADCRRDGIRERNAFIEKLKNILRTRGVL